MYQLWLHDALCCKSISAEKNMTKADKQLLAMLCSNRQREHQAMTWLIRHKRYPFHLDQQTASAKHAWKAFLEARSKGMNVPKACKKAYQIESFRAMSYLVFCSMIFPYAMTDRQISEYRISWSNALKWQLQERWDFGKDRDTLSRTAHRTFNKHQASSSLYWLTLNMSEPDRHRHRHHHHHHHNHHEHHSADQPADHHTTHYHQYVGEAHSSM